MGTIEDRWRLGLTRRDALLSLAGMLAGSPLLPVCLLAVIGVLYLTALRDQLRPLETLLVVALPAITGNLVWLLSTGMEHGMEASYVRLETTFASAH